MAKKEDPFAILREKIRKKKLEEQQKRADKLKGIAAKLRGGEKTEKPAPAPRSKPAPRPRPRPAPKTPDTSAEHRPRGKTAKIQPAKPDSGALPPPKGLIRHTFAFEDLSKMKKSKGRYKPGTPQKFDSHRYDSDK
jgi:hypothetical protein